MRWLGFAICAVVMLTLQTTVAWRVAIVGVAPEWMLVLAVFFTLHARSADALIGAWLLGAAMDVMTIERFGLISGCYGVSMLAIFSVREYVFRDNPLTHFALTFAAAIVLGAVLATYHTLMGHQIDPGTLGVGGRILLASVYTAAWALPLHYVLLKIPHLLGVHPPRRSRTRSRGG